MISFFPIKNDKSLLEGFRLRKIDWDLILKEFELLQIESQKQFAENLKALITHSNLIDIDNESFVETPLHIWSDIQDKVEVFLYEKGLLNSDNFKDIVELFQRKKKSEWLNIFDCWCPLFSQLPNYYNLDRCFGKNYPADPADECLNIIKEARELWGIYYGDSIFDIKSTYPTRPALLITDKDPRPFLLVENILGITYTPVRPQSVMCPELASLDCLYHDWGNCYSLKCLYTARILHDASGNIIFKATSEEKNRTSVSESIGGILKWARRYNYRGCSQVPPDRILAAMTISSARLAFQTFIEENNLDSKFGKDMFFEAKVLLKEAQRLNGLETTNKEKRKLSKHIHSLRKEKINLEEDVKLLDHRNMLLIKERKKINKHIKQRNAIIDAIEGSKKSRRVPVIKTAKRLIIQNEFNGLRKFAMEIEQDLKNQEIEKRSMLSFETIRKDKEIKNLFYEKYPDKK